MILPLKPEGVADARFLCGVADHFAGLTPGLVMQADGLFAVFVCQQLRGAQVVGMVVVEGPGGRGLGAGLQQRVFFRVVGPVLRVPFGDVQPVDGFGVSGSHPTFIPACIAAPNADSGDEELAKAKTRFI